MCPTLPNTQEGEAEDASLLGCSSPEPEKAKSRKRKQAPVQPSKPEPEAAAEDAAEDAEAEQGAAEDAFHFASADLFRDWLAQHKAQLAAEEEVCTLCRPPDSTVVCIADQAYKVP